MQLMSVGQAVVVAPAEEGQGGLGRSAGDFAFGLRALGINTTYVGPQPRSALDRVAGTRLARRVSSSPQRLLLEAGVRKAVPRRGWDLAYSVAGSTPTKRDAGIVCIHQSTHHPRIEFERLQAARRSTGGRSDFGLFDLRRREFEIARADLIHVTSMIVRDEFLSAGVSPLKVIHAYPGVDLDAYKPGDKSGNLKIAFIGAFSMRKGVDVAVKLSRELPRQVEILTVGGPVDRWSRRHIESAGFGDVDSVPVLLSRCDVLILPSRSDAFAHVVLEALASGVIPIVTPEVGSCEIVRRLDPRLVVDLEHFATEVPRLLGVLDVPSLRTRARTLATEFGRMTRAEAAVLAVLEGAAALKAERRRNHN